MVCDAAKYVCCALCETGFCYDCAFELRYLPASPDEDHAQKVKPEDWETTPAPAAVLAVCSVCEGVAKGPLRKAELEVMLTTLLKWFNRCCKQPLTSEQLREECLPAPRLEAWWAETHDTPVPPPLKRRRATH